jgi:hypothetical protein
MNNQTLGHGGVWRGGCTATRILDLCVKWEWWVPLHPDPCTSRKRGSHCQFLGTGWAPEPQKRSRGFQWIKIFFPCIWKSFGMIRFDWWWSLTNVRKVLRLSGRSVAIYHSTQSDIQEGLTLQRHRCDNLKFRISYCARKWKEIKHRMVWWDSTMGWGGLVRKLLRMLHGNALAYECNNRKAMKNPSQDRRCHNRHLKRVHWGQPFVSCECETRPFALRGEYIPKGFENGLLRIIFGLQGEQKNVCNSYLHHRG